MNTAQIVGASVGGGIGLLALIGGAVAAYLRFRPIDPGPEPLKAGIPPEVFAQLYQATFDVSRILEKAKIRYWAKDGTSLGQVRHGGIIPWDDDVDLAIHEDDRKKFLALRGDFDKCGYGLSKWWGGYKVYKKDGQSTGFKWKFPFVDIFFMKPQGDWMIHSSSKARKVWPKEKFKKSEFLPLKKMRFGDFNLNSINKPKTVLKRQYGEDVFTHAYRQYDHKLERAVKKVKVELAPADKVPGRPTAVVLDECMKGAPRLGRRRASTFWTTTIGEKK